MNDILNKIPRHRHEAWISGLSMGEDAWAVSEMVECDHGAWIERYHPVLRAMEEYIEASEAWYNRGEFGHLVIAIHERVNAARDELKSLLGGQI